MSNDAIPYIASNLFAASKRKQKVTATQCFLAVCYKTPEWRATQPSRHKVVQDEDLQQEVQDVADMVQILDPLSVHIDEFTIIFSLSHAI